MGISPNAAAMSWALERSGISKDVILRKWPKFDQWLDGTWCPTVKQIRDFADTVHINVSALFSDSLPDLGLQIADFRTVDDRLNATQAPSCMQDEGKFCRRST